MSDAQRRRTRAPRKSQKTASPKQIRQGINEMLMARAIEFSLGLHDERIDWAMMLSLHLQMVELEALETAMAELL
jgi:diacylglycerol kinase